MLRSQGQPPLSLLKDTEAPLTTDTLPVQAKNVSKIYGRTAALRGVSLELQPGRFYVLRGENGAGKSTLLRMVAGLSQPTQGEILIFGKQTRDAHQEIGYMGHAPLVYDELSGMENLRFFAQLYGIKSDAPLEKALALVPAIEHHGDFSSAAMAEYRLRDHSPTLAA